MNNNKKPRDYREYCEGCGIFSLVNENGICLPCLQEALDEEDDSGDEDVANMPAQRE